MNRLMRWLLASSLLLGLSACGPSDDDHSRVVPIGEAVSKGPSQPQSVAPAKNIPMH